MQQINCFDSKQNKKQWIQMPRVGFKKIKLNDVHTINKIILNKSGREKTENYMVGYVEAKRMLEIE